VGGIWQLALTGRRALDVSESLSDSEAPMSSVGLSVSGSASSSKWITHRTAVSPKTGAAHQTAVMSDPDLQARQMTATFH
jgi:hypothetical protein